MAAPTTSRVLRRTSSSGNKVPVGTGAHPLPLEENDSPEDEFVAEAQAEEAEPEVTIATDEL